MSRDGTTSIHDETSHRITDESNSDSEDNTRPDTPKTQYTVPMVSPSSVESTTSVETVRPTPISTTNTAGGSPGTTVSGGGTPRSPMLRRQPSAPSTLQHVPAIPPQQQSIQPSSLVSPRLPPVSESRHGGGPPSITSIGTSSVHRSSARRNPPLRAPLQRLASYLHGEPAYSSDEDSESAAEADMEAVQHELERSWEHHHPGGNSGTGTIRQRRRHSGGTSRGKGSQRGGAGGGGGGGRSYEDDMYNTTIRRTQTTPYFTHTRHESDIDDPIDDERPQSRLNRHHNEVVDQEDSSSDGVPDSEASFTLKDRQDAINITHPFGLKIWKPALYKKSRSVQRTAEGEIHSRPGQWPDRKIRLGNVLWTLLFGWWMSLITTIVACILLVSTWWSAGAPYAFVLFGLARYLFYPFGRFIELLPDEAYAEEDEGEGRSISEYERYGAVDLERGRQLGIFTSSPIGENRRGLIGRRRGPSIESWGEYSEQDSLLGGDTARNTTVGEDESGPGRKRRFFGRGQWSVGRIFFFTSFYLIIAPILLLVCGLCWLTVFALPMAKVMSVIVSHLRRHPLSMTFHSDLRTAASRRPGTPSAQVLLCTYRAWGWEYYKYTVDGTNIFLFNLVFVVFFTIADEFFLAPLLHHKYWIVNPAFIFTLALASIVPLAYFIGMAVASISAQSSMGMGAAINAFFGSVVEVFLYSVALTQGKSRLVEGSVIGSIFAGCLLMPGTSMLFGAMRRKTQRFNAKSAGVTSTMLLFAVIGAFAPTIFYQIYGTSELRCTACDGVPRGEEDCQRCYWDQANALTDPFYMGSVKPFSYICSVFLVTSYVIGLWFSLRTHAAQIWEMPLHAPDFVPPQMQQAPINRSASLANWRDNIPDEPFLKRIGERMSSRFLHDSVVTSPTTDRTDGGGDRVVSGGSGTNGAQQQKRIPSNSDRGGATLASSFTPEDSAQFVRNVAEVAAAAATLAVHNSQSPNTTPQPTPRVLPVVPLSMPPSMGHSPKVTAPRTPDVRHHGGHDWEVGEQADLAGAAAPIGGHDAPNWSRTKSSMILLGATILYAIIAEILVDTVDVVLGSGTIDEKFLGFTLFALVPNTTEFLNAISFALNGNIALSMEIGSAYALQVCLLQIPALVAVSAFLNAGKQELQESTFSLIFPRWDLITVILCVFLLAYMYGEGKSNYFKGSILMLAYGVVLMGGLFIPRFPDEAITVAGLPRTG